MNSTCRRSPTRASPLDVEAVAGPAVAGLLVALLGLRWVFWFDAFTYLLSAMLVQPQSYRVWDGGAAGSWRAFLNEITHGSRVLLREPALRQALTLSFAEATAGAAAIVATVAYVRDTLGRGETAFAMIMAGLGLGSTLAAVMLGKATGRYERGANDQAVLHGRRHRWAARALLSGWSDARTSVTARRARAAVVRLQPVMDFERRGSGADCDFVINAVGRTYGFGGARTRLCRALCADALPAGSLPIRQSDTRRRSGERPQHSQSQDRVSADHSRRQDLWPG